MINMSNVFVNTFCMYIYLNAMVRGITILNNTSIIFSMQRHLLAKNMFSRKVYLEDFEYFGMFGMHTKSANATWRGITVLCKMSITFSKQRHLLAKNEAELCCGLVYLENFECFRMLYELRRYVILTI